MEDQCLGTTKAGARCKIKTNLVNGYCRIHQHQSPGKDTDVSGESSPAGQIPVQEKTDTGKTVPPVEKIEQHPSAETPVGERELINSLDTAPPSRSKSVMLFVSGILISLIVIITALTRKR
ncbi:MAG: DUF5763 domain-containing protein [Fibrobacterota bacterium]